ncbi:MAG: phospholipase D family protein [Deltaproteobacteria bacterium]|nr:phospholipase D family protein [Deltaproteobacteria bacterium]
MRKSFVFDSANSFAAEFARCCREYKTLNIAVAWCGNPNQTLPYKLLEDFGGSVKAIVGIAFNHTHPDAIEWFINIDADIRIFRDDAELFHPKVYLFRDQHHYALFIGSSNLTYGGFYTNCETNCLIEGTASTETAKDIDSLEETLAKWHTPTFSFQPTTRWLKGYRQRYKTTAQKQQEQGIHTPSGAEEGISTASWLRQADWDIYYKKVVAGLKQHEREGEGYHDVLDAAAREVPIPWTTQYFQDIEKRRIIGGIKQYGWLGHVAASGQFRSLLANGTHKQWKSIVEAVNAISKLNPPIPWAKLKSHLDQLISLGPTMKVWGRLLCIVRPDLYCTVAAVSVRKNLSKTLGVPQSRFDGSEGYIQLIKLIHSSPWFNSKEPTNKTQAAIWKRRAAFLDAIFY